MRVVVVDPTRRRVIHVPQVTCLPTYCIARLGETAQFYPLSSSSDGEPGLSVCREESADVLRPGQRYFRFSRCPVTFPGLCVFFGQETSGRPCSPPSWFWRRASGMPLWCDPSTRLLCYTIGNFDREIDGVGKVTEVKYLPVFTMGKRREGERHVASG